MQMTVAALIAMLAISAKAGPVSLQGARFTATHEATPTKPSVALAFDDDEATSWAGDGHDLTELASNIVVTFPQPVTVGSMQVVTEVLKERLRLSHLEVYAPVGDDWALLGAVRDIVQTRFTVALKPARVKQLRLRVRDNARPDHCWPRIVEIAFFEPEPGAVLEPLSPAPVENESAGERLFLAAATGNLPAAPTTTFDPNKGYLGYARDCLDTLIASGTDTLGTATSPMFISILATADHKHPGCELPPIHGQRQGDRASFGGNLQHDMMLLEAARRISDLTGDPRYAQAADDYLRFFLNNCTTSATGLWPWGEHAHWDFIKEAPGHVTHEYLGAAPLDFWERAWAMNPAAVLREADGLINHVVNLETFDYNRHADISAPLPTPRPADMTFLDFPRHGGFYIQVWAFAYSKTGEQRYLDWCEKMMDHHSAMRHPKSGLMPSTSSSPANAGITTQLSLAITMLESVPLFGDTPTGKRCDQLAGEYLAALARLPHRPAEGKVCTRTPVSGPGEDIEKCLSTPAFDADYGGEFLCMDGLLWVQAYRVSGNTRFLDIARGIAGFYAREPRVPEQTNTRAKVFGSLVELMLDMAELDGGDQWLPAAESYARQGVELLYHNGIFRGATGLWYYESELWPSTFVHSLVRLAAVLDGKGTQVPTNYFHR